MSKSPYNIINDALSLTYIWWNNMILITCMRKFLISVNDILHLKIMKGFCNKWLNLSAYLKNVYISYSNCSLNFWED